MGYGDIDYLEILDISDGNLFFTIERNFNNGFLVSSNRKKIEYITKNNKNKKYYKTLKKIFG